jgi:glycolate oxidase
VEFIDRTSARTACSFLNETINYRDAGAMLLITVDGPDDQQVAGDYEAIGELCLGEGAFEVYVADNPTTSQRLWKIRHAVPEAFAAMGSSQGNEDLVVPMASIPRLVAGMEALSARYGVTVPAYGHAGDGNLHTRIVKNPQWSSRQWQETFPKVLHELYELTASLGGRVSGEHGIGHKRKPYMPMFVSQEYLQMLRAIKVALDPGNILNPGKIFDV